MLTAVMVGSTRDLLSYMQQICAEFEGLCVYKSLDSYPHPHELIRLLNAYAPEVVFLETGGSETPLALARQIRSYNPKTAIIGFTQECDGDQLVQATQAGIDAILLPPFSAEEFQKVLVQALEDGASGAADNIIAFLPAKGGSGATTAAMNVAGWLAQGWKQKVLLIEADLQSGLLASLLNVKPEKSVIDALESSHQLDDLAWSKLTCAAGGFELLATPASQGASKFPRWNYHRLLTFVRPRYDTVIVDLPAVVHDELDPVLTQAKCIYIVCTPEVPSLLLARRKVHALRARDLQQSRINIVLNRHVESDVSLTEVEEALERRISLILPNDYFAVRTSIFENGLVNQDTKLGQAFCALAATVAGKPLPPPPPEAKAKPGWRSRLLGRALQST